MTRLTYYAELGQLQDEMMAVADLVERALVRSVELLKERDFEGSRQLVAADREINERRYGIEEWAIMLIATQGPVASDVRLLAAILETATELERIGDYAKGIARINLMIGAQPLIKPLIDLPAMAQAAAEMLHDAMLAFVKRDVDAARAIPSRDDQIDDLYNEIYSELIARIVRDPSLAEQANKLLWAAHNLERAADRVVNLCERVVYAFAGELIEFDADEPGVEGLG